MNIVATSSVSKLGRVCATAFRIQFLFALGFGAILLFALGAIAMATFAHSKHYFSSISETCDFFVELHKTITVVGRLESLERAHPLAVENPNGALVEHRAAVNARLARLDQLSRDIALNIPPFPRLHPHAHAGHGEYANNSHSILDVSGNPWLAAAQSNSNVVSLDALQVHLTDAYDATHEEIDQLLHRQGEWHRRSIVAWAFAAATASLLLVIAFPVIWRSLVAGRRSKSAAPLPLDASAPASPPDSFAHVDVSRVIEATRSEERARISRNLHDDLGAHLMVVKIVLKRASSHASNKCRRALDAQWAQLLGEVDAAMEAVVRVAGGLRPAIVDNLGLRQAVESHVRRFEEVTGIRCTLRIGENSVSLSLYEETVGEIFRVIQEALTNIGRHAEASMVNVNIDVENDKLAISITDNGKGICADKVASKHSLGLNGMSERIHRIGGELRIDRRPEGGTKVTFRLPAPGPL